MTAPTQSTAMTTPTNQEKICPTELDILCGKTKQIINHPGTIRYQRIVESYTQRYINAESKFDKMSVTKDLYDHLKTTSRFLKYNEKEKTWEEITALAARDKVGHALRFAVNNVNSEKRRMKSKRGGHRRIGSDFSAASLTSIASSVSVNTTASAATATSDGGPMVQSLMHALASNFNIEELKGTMPIVSTATKKPASEIPLTASQTIPENPLLAATAGGEFPLMAPSSSVGEHPLLSSRGLPFIANTTGSNAGSDSSPPFAVLGTEPPLQVSSNHSSENDLVTSNPLAAPPPLREVVTTTEMINQEFLSMLHEPIYEFDIDDDL